MSIHLVLIRHGESAGNAGLRTSDHRKIPLTELGMAQAEVLSKAWAETPDIIYLSPFQRAQETAQPTIHRFPSTQVRTSDDLQEFTYLSPATCVNTTKEERRPRVDAYWTKLDPSYVDGADAESFAELADRTHHFLQEIRSLPDASTVFAFSHMMCITCIRTWLDHPDADLKERMRMFRTYPFIQNTERLDFQLGRKIKD